MGRVIEIACMYYVVVGFGSIGILLGVSSLCLRYREVKKLWARRICLISDILNTTFVSITVVGVLTVSLELAIHLPDLARSQDISENVNLADLTKGQSEIREDIDKLRDAIPRQVDESGLATKINRFIQEEFQRKDLYSAISHLHDIGELNEYTLARAVGEMLGNMGTYSLIRLGGSLPEVKWSCHNDGPLQCTIDDN